MGEEIDWETRKILHAGTLQLPSTFYSGLQAYFFQQDPDGVDQPRRYLGCTRLNAETTANCDKLT